MRSYDFVATLLGISGALYLRAAVALAMGVAGAVLAYFLSDEPWAIFILAVSLSLSVGVFFESLWGGVGGFFLGLATFSIVPELTVICDISARIHPAYAICELDRQTTQKNGLAPRLPSP